MKFRTSFLILIMALFCLGSFQPANATDNPANVEAPVFADALEMFTGNDLADSLSADVLPEHFEVDIPDSLTTNPDTPFVQSKEGKWIQIEIIYHSLRNARHANYLSIRNYSGYLGSPG